MNKPKMLELLSEKVANCTKCQELTETRTQTVFGEGNYEAQLMFIGECPGAEEDRMGRPFVGKAGKLLDNIIKAMNIKREDVFIANILKCHPPNNRVTSQEANNCEGFLKLQIKIIQPKVIICLGYTAAHHLLKIDTPISRLRGIWKEYNSIPVMPTFHPSYLLRFDNPDEAREAKSLVWQDMKQVLEKINYTSVPD